MTAAPDILAIDVGGIDAIVMVVVMLLAAAGNLLKKKQPKPGEGQGEGTVPPPTGSPADRQSPMPQARPSTARQQGVARPRPLSGGKARPTPTTAQQPPQVRPTPIARQQPPQARPTPIQQPAVPGSVPRRLETLAQPKQPPRSQRPQRATAKREGHRVHAAGHAEQVASHAEHNANRLKEEQLRKAGKLKPGEHAHGDQQPIRRRGHSLRAMLNATDLKQAIILSEIIQPPLALRESNQSLD